MVLIMVLLNSDLNTGSIFSIVAIGWRISEEKFMKTFVPQLSNLKIKYSIGLIGNDNFNGVGMWPFLTTYIDNPDNLARFGNSILTDTPYNVAFRESTPGNPESPIGKPHESNDIGLEFDLLMV